MDYKDYYKILGVNKNSGADEIKKAYRKLAKEYHPDSAKGDRKKAEEKFKEISEAYEVIGDAEKRKKYDQMMEEIKNGGFNPSDFTGYNGAGKNGNGVYTYTWTNGGDGANGFPDGFSDFFNMFFTDIGDDEAEGDMFSGFNTRSSPRRGRKTRRDGEDLEDTLRIGVTEAYSGAVRTLRIGSRTIEIKIPAGIMSGERIKAAGQGMPGRNGGKNGNLYLVIQVEPDKGYTLNGLDAEKEIDLYPWEASLGCRKTVEAFDMKLSANIPAGIQAGERIRLSGKGYRNIRGERGDLYLKIRLVNPSAMSDKARDLYIKLRDIYSH